MWHLPLWPPLLCVKGFTYHDNLFPSWGSLLGSGTAVLSWLNLLGSGAELYGVPAPLCTPAGKAWWCSCCLLDWSCSWLQFLIWIYGSVNTFFPPLDSQQTWCFAESLVSIQHQHTQFSVIYSSDDLQRASQVSVTAFTSTPLIWLWLK